ncbi:hypothetical protein [Rhabdochlamydiaceae symbiont of Dictyostelium giganteum]|uniref:hypothetical protein n=1 Tax=Rhabdochlamydiaceae symbiont of Dictyostelium giganteum TaxID=3342349 RepID=UPI00384EE9ED
MSLSVNLKINMKHVMTELQAIENPVSLMSHSLASSSLLTRLYESFVFQPKASQIKQISSSTPSPSEAASFSSLIQNSSLQCQSIQKVMHPIVYSDGIPPLYRELLINPFYQEIEKGIMSYSNAHLAEVICTAIQQNFALQKEITSLNQSLKALREVVSDLYKKFIVDADGASCVNKKGKASPVAYWSEECLSTYAYHPGAPFFPGVKVGIVNVPKRYAEGSAIAWGCLGHEVAGHDILATYPGSRKELEEKIRQNLINQNLSLTLEHWENRVEETAADILGVLNMGPAAAFSLIAFLRILRSTPSQTLIAEVYLKDKHPADLARGFLLANAVSFMHSKGFTKGKNYGSLLFQELERDCQFVTEFKVNQINMGTRAEMRAYFKEFCAQQRINLRLPFYYTAFQSAHSLLNDSHHKEKFTEFLLKKQIPQTLKEAKNAPNIHSMTMKYTSISIQEMKRSAEVVAYTIMNSKLQALQGRSLADIRCWSDTDEKNYEVFRSLLRIEEAFDPVKKYKEGFFAAHVVSAAVMESILEEESNPLTAQKIKHTFSRMLTILQTMHQTNNEWQPLKKRVKLA